MQATKWKPADKPPYTAWGHERVSRAGCRGCAAVDTVKKHVTHILSKLGLHGRVQAVVLAHQTGFFEAEPTRSDGSHEMGSFALDP